MRTTLILMSMVCLGLIVEVIWLHYVTNRLTQCVIGLKDWNDKQEQKIINLRSVTNDLKEGGREK